MTVLASHPTRPAGSRFTPKEAPMFDATTELAHDGPTTRARVRRKPAEYRLYYAIVFAVALPIAAVRCIFPRTDGYLERAPSEPRGVLSEARALTETVVPYLFMG